MTAINTTIASRTSVKTEIPTFAYAKNNCVGRFIGKVFNAACDKTPACVKNFLSYPVNKFNGAPLYLKAIAVVGTLGFACYNHKKVRKAVKRCWSRMPAMPTSASSIFKKPSAKTQQFEKINKDDKEAINPDSSN